MVEDAARRWIEAVPPGRRPLFDRVHALVVEAFPEVDVVVSYDMPTFVVGERRLHVGVWAHGLSFYGWSADRDDGFAGRHPELSSGRGTLRLSPAAAARLADGELAGFLRAALGPHDAA